MYTNIFINEYKYINIYNLQYVIIIPPEISKSKHRSPLFLIIPKEHLNNRKFWRQSSFNYWFFSKPFVYTTFIVVKSRLWTLRDWRRILPLTISCHWRESIYLYEPQFLLQNVGKAAFKRIKWDNVCNLAKCLRHREF